MPKRTGAKNTDGGHIQVQRVTDRIGRIVSAIRRGIARQNRRDAASHHGHIVTNGQLTGHIGFTYQRAETGTVGLDFFTVDEQVVTDESAPGIHTRTHIKLRHLVMKLGRIEAEFGVTRLEFHLCTALPGVTGLHVFTPAHGSARAKNEGLATGVSKIGKTEVTASGRKTVLLPLQLVVSAD